MNNMNVIFTEAVCFDKQCISFLQKIGFRIMGPHTNNMGSLRELTALSLLLSCLPTFPRHLRGVGNLATESSAYEIFFFIVEKELSELLCLGFYYTVYIYYPFS